MSGQTFASLGISITTTGVSQAVQELQSLATTSKTAENSIIQLSETTKARMQAEDAAAVTRARQVLVDRLAGLTQLNAAEAEYAAKRKAINDNAALVEEAYQKKRIANEDETANKLIQIKSKILAKEIEDRAESIRLMREHNTKRIVEEEATNVKLLELEAKKKVANLGGLGGGGGTGLPAQPFQVGSLGSLTGVDVRASQQEDKNKKAEEAYQKYIKAVEEMDASLARMQKEKADQTEFYIEATLKARQTAYENMWANLLAKQEKYQNVAGTMSSSQPVNIASYDNTAASTRMISGMSASGAEARRIEEEAAQARRNILAQSYRQETQLVVNELNQRLEMESAIRLHGAESNKVIMLRASQDEVAIRRKMAAELAEVERQIASGAINTSQAQNQATEAIIRRSEAEINAARAIGDTARAAEQAGHHHNTLNNIFNRTIGILSAMVAYRTFSFLVDTPKQILDTNVEMEKLNVLLEGVTGSAEKAKVTFQALARLDLKTPFDIEGLTKTFVMLNNYGLQPTEFIMKSLTDQVAKLGGGTEQLVGIGRQLGQAWAKDKLQMVDMRPMIENGLPVISLLSKALDKTAAEILAMSSAGQLGREEMMKLFEQMEKDSPNAAARNMDTLHGALTNVTTAWTQFQDSLIEEKGEKRLTEFFNRMSDGLLYLKNLMSDTTDWNIELKRNAQQIEDTKSAALGYYGEDTSGITEKRMAGLIKEKEFIQNKLNEQIAKEKELNKQRESATAKDLEAINISEKQQKSAIKLAEANDKIQQAVVATQNSNMDIQIEKAKSLYTNKIAGFEAERKVNDDNLARNLISIEQRKAVEIDLIQKITAAKTASLNEIEKLEKSKLATHIADVDKAYAAIIQVESGGQAGQVNRTSGALGQGQALASTLTGINAKGENVGVGYGMPAFKPAVDENIKQISDAYKKSLATGDALGAEVYYQKLVEFSKKYDTELKDWTAQYFKQLVAATGSVDAALKIYGENTPQYAQKIKEAYANLNGETVKQNQLNIKTMQTQAEMAKVGVDSQVQIAKAVSDAIKQDEDYRKGLEKVNAEYEALTGNAALASKAKAELKYEPMIEKSKTILADTKSTQPQIDEAKATLDKINAIGTLTALQKRLNDLNVQRNEFENIYSQDVNLVNVKINSGALSQMSGLIELNNLRTKELQNLKTNIELREKAIELAQKEGKVNSVETQKNIKDLDELKAKYRILEAEGDLLGNKFKTSVGDAMQSSLEGMILKTQTAQQAFASFAQSIVADIAKIIASEIRSKIIGELFGAALGGLGSVTGITSWGAAKNVLSGNTFNGSGPLKTFANADGGVYSGAGISSYSNSVVSSPTLFPFASGVGLMGEAGPEAIMPLKRNASGVLGIQADNGNAGNTTVNNVTINVQAAKGDSGADMGNKAAEAFMRTIAKQEIVSAARPGNVLNRTTKFGVS